MHDDFATEPLDQIRGTHDRDEAPADWSDLHLEHKAWTEEILELRLEIRGAVTSRCLATRSTQEFLEPAGPLWARTLLLEAATEWRGTLPPAIPTLIRSAAGLRHFSN